MSQLRFDDRPGDLRRRANRLRDVARGVSDAVALRELERLIAELEEKADGSETGRQARDGGGTAPSRHEPIGKGRAA